MPGLMDHSKQFGFYWMSKEKTLMGFCSDMSSNIPLLLSRKRTRSRGAR